MMPQGSLGLQSPETLCELFPLLLQWEIPWLQAQDGLLVVQALQSEQPHKLSLPFLPTQLLQK